VVLHDKEPIFLESLFRSWKDNFPVADYDDSTDEDEKTYIANQVKRVSLIQR
jgi:hypothetical protein